MSRVPFAPSGAGWLAQLAADPLATMAEVRLTASEIARLLRDRTAIGSWQSIPYRQFFSSDGTTVHALKGQRSSRGAWRTDAARDRYESRWDGGAWDSCGVIRRDGDLYWICTGLPAQPFRVIDGWQLVWPE